MEQLIVAFIKILTPSGLLGIAPLFEKLLSIHKYEESKKIASSYLLAMTTYCIGDRAVAGGVAASHCPLPNQDIVIARKEARRPKQSLVYLHIDEKHVIMNFNWQIWNFLESY